MGVMIAPFPLCAESDAQPSRGGASLRATRFPSHCGKTANLFADHHNRTHRRAPNCGRFLWFSNCLRSELKPRAWRGFLFIEVKAEADSRLTHTSSVIVLWLLVGCSWTSLPWPSPLRP
jgi:hypothetical protein